MTEIVPIMRMPMVIPSGWRIEGSMIVTRTRGGLLATFAVETYPGGTRGLCGPGEQPGTFRRLVLSRRKMYPTWDEMRDFIRACGLFDRTRDVMMVIPPDREYVNVHPHAFHWWQKVEARE